MDKSIRTRSESAQAKASLLESSLITFEKHVQALFENNNEEEENENINYNRIDQLRTIIYKTLTHPSSSIPSAFVYLLTILVASLSVTLMIIGTVNTFQITPTECHYCDGNVGIKIDEEFITSTYNENVADYCVCPPEAMPIFHTIQYICQVYFTIELFLRITCYVPYKDYNSSHFTRLKQWSKILIFPSTIIDFLAILPFIIDLSGTTVKIFGFFRLFRLFLVFRMARFSGVSKTLSVVLWKSATNLCMLVIVLLIGSCLFGTLIFWSERGQWEYTDLTDPPSYQFVRKSVDGMTDEISPFKSIPGSFYWFFVTVTTVGYGDFCPTSAHGKLITVIAVLLGLLVVAFPVSVFAELWSMEMEKRGFVRSILTRERIEGNEDGKEIELNCTIHDTNNEDYSNAIEGIKSLSNQEIKMKKSSLIIDRDKYEHILHNLLMINESKNEIHRRLKVIDKAEEQIKQILSHVDMNENS